MLPTFVIGLREGLEAALIVGIIAAFLRRQGRRDLLRWVLVGVGAAVLLCAAGGVAMQALSRSLPQRQQEGLETVIGAVAVVMVTYMVVWMRRHSRELKGQLEVMAVAATGRGARAMIAMAFLAVIREGFETVVFLLAAFNETSSGAAAGVGASLGLVAAVLLGWAIYRGGVRLNLSRLFRVTGFVLVLVAAGLVVNTLHTAHEAGWLDLGQGPTVDLSALVRPGSVQSALLTGMLGVQAHPVAIEALGWLLYLVPVGSYVAWPPGRPVPMRGLAATGAALAAVAASGSIALAVSAPALPVPDPRVVALDERAAKVRVDGVQYRLAAAGAAVRSGVPAREYRAAAAAASRAQRASAAEVAAAHGGRLPIGVRPAADGTVAANSVTRTTVVAWIEPRTAHLLALSRRTVTTLVVADTPVSVRQRAVPLVADEAAGARAALDALERRHDLHTLGAWLRGFAVVSAALSLAAWSAARWRGRLHRNLAAQPVRPLVVR